MVIVSEMDPNVTKLVNFAQIWTCRPLIRPIIHQRVMLECPESPKSPHKLVLPENVSISAFYTVILGEMGTKVAILINCFNPHKSRKKRKIDYLQAQFSA